MGLKKIILLCLLMLVLLGGSVYGYELLNVEVERVYVEMPQIKLYINVISQQEEKIDKLEDNTEITAKLDGEEMMVASYENFQSSGEGLAVTYLIDISKSISSIDFDDIKQNILNKIEGMQPNDKAAIITFGQEVSIYCEYTNNKDLLTSKIENLELTDYKTRFYDGMMKAISLSGLTDEGLPDRRVIIIVTDGSDEFPGGVTKQEVISSIESNSVPIYSVGIYSGSLSDEKQNNLDILGEFSRTSKGMYYQMNNKSFDDIFAEIDKNINNTQILTISCGDMKADSTTHQLYISIDKDGKKVETVSDVLLSTNMEDKTPPEVSEVTSDNTTQVTICFSESVQGADIVENFTFLDSEGVRIFPSAIEYSEDEKYASVVNFDVELAGEYTVTIRGIKDASDTPNTILEQTESFVVDNVIEKERFEDKDKVIKIMIYAAIGLLVLLVLVIAIVVAVRKKNSGNSQLENGVGHGLDIPVTRPMKSVQKTVQKSAAIGKKLHFSIMDNQNNHKAFDKNIDKELYIGRATDCDISFKDDEMSRKHLKISHEKHSLYANDMNPTNATVINGVPIKGRMRLSSGDVLLVGQTEIKITFDEDIEV